MKKIVIFLTLLLPFVVSAQKQISVKRINVDSTLIWQGDTIDFTDYINTVDSIHFLQFKTDTVNPAYGEGRLFYDSASTALSFYTDNSDVTLQIGQENWIKVFNNSGSDIPNGSVVYIDSAITYPTIELAKADLPTTVDRVIGVTTHVIGNGERGYVTTFGLVRDLNTSSYNEGDQIYLSAATPGAFTATQPEYPFYQIRVGSVIKSDASDGEILVNIIGQPEDIIVNAFNGNFLESFDFRTTSNGTTIKGFLDRSDASDNLTMNFSDGFTLLDVSPADTIALTGGTTTVPQVNYVYIPKSTKTLTVSTSFWPNAEHIPIAQLLLLDATTTQSNGALRNQNINDHLAGDDGQGHISHIGARIRRLNAAWESGSEGSATIVATGTPDSVFISNTEGKIWQMHLQTFPAMDMRTGSDIHIVNDPTTPYTTVTNLGSTLTDASGGSLSGRSFSFVVWGVINKTGEASHLMLNLPTGSYTSASNAIADVQGYSVYSIPNTFTGVGFLIARFTFSHSSSGGGTWTLQDTEDLRGTVPNNTAGGGVGGVGVTTFLGLTDSPSSYSGNADKVVNVSSGETAVEFTDIWTLLSPAQSYLYADTIQLAYTTGNWIRTTGWTDGEETTSITLSDSTFVIQETGTYRIFYHMTERADNNGTTRWVVRQNSTELLGSYTTTTYFNPAYPSREITKRLSQNDTVSLWFNNSSAAGNMNIYNGTFGLQRVK